MTRLFHFSESGDIAHFVPRPVRTPASRAAEHEWLNGPLVWAIAEDHQRLYLFPRECPRIVMWAHAETSTADRQAWLEDAAPGASAIAYIEDGWRDRVERASIFRYELPGEGFTDLGDAGMHVSRAAVTPSDIAQIQDLHAALAGSGTALKSMPSLRPLKSAWASSMHVSGIRLRNARDWT